MSSSNKQTSTHEAGVVVGGASSGNSSAMHYTLWIVQGLLALLFLWGGGFKLFASIEQMTAQLPLPGWFLRFIGLAEVLGGIGLILPQLLGIKPVLTPLAAVGLIIIMIGATVITLMTGPAAAALFPALTGLLLVFVAYGRRSYFKAA